jgi:hypothetical protein
MVIIEYFFQIIHYYLCMSGYLFSCNCFRNRIFPGRIKGIAAEYAVSRECSSQQSAEPFNCLPAVCAAHRGKAAAGSILGRNYNLEKTDHQIGSAAGRVVY